MTGIIITTGQRPSNGGVRKSLKSITRKGQFAWRGMPGVTYPDEIEQNELAETQAEKPSGEQWISTREAAKILEAAISTARRKLQSANIRSIRVNQGGMFWRREDVNDLAQQSALERIAAPPEGWLTATDACELYNISRTSLQRYCASGKIRHRRVKIGTLPCYQNNTRIIMMAEDIEAVIRLWEESKKA